MSKKTEKILDFSQKEAQDAYDFLEMAEQAETDIDAIKYAKKALALDPDMLDADLLIACVKNQEFAAQQKALEKLLKKGEAQLQAQDISTEKNMGDFYLLLETRPYMRVYHHYVRTLIAQNKLRKAAQACEEILRLNPNDNLGSRYDLMAVYAALEDQQALEQLYKKYRMEHSAFMLLPAIALYYKLDNQFAAKRYITKLCNSIEGAKQAFEMIEREDDAIINLLNTPYYKPYSQQEIMIAYESAPYLYGPIFEFLSWLIPRCPDNTSPEKKKKSTKRK